MDLVVQSVSPHGRLRYVSRRRQILGNESREYFVKHLGQQIDQIILGSRDSILMAVRTSWGIRGGGVGPIMRFWCRV